MTLTGQINDDVKTAMKARDKDTLKVIRMLKSALQMEQLKQDDPLTEDQELTVINREMKQRRDSLKEFDAAGRDDLVAELEDEIVIVEKYLPKQLSEDEVRAQVQQVIQETGATSMADFGKVMGTSMARVKGQADGNLVNQLAKEELSK